MTTRRTSEIDVTPARHFAMASDTIGAMPARAAASSSTSDSASRPMRSRTSFVISKSLEDANAAAIADPAASLAALRLEDDVACGKAAQFKARICSQVRGGELTLRLAAIAEQPHEPLSEH